MKLLRVGNAGRERPAALDAMGCLRHLSHSVREIDLGILGEEALDKLCGLDLTALPEIAGTPRTGPCVAGTRKIVCVGLNYRDHAVEAALPIPVEPVLFLKATSAIVGPDVGDELRDRKDHRTSVAMLHPASIISRFMTLQPGDVIATGTPAGVGFGHKPPVYLQPGQVMRLGIAGLGTQQQRAVAAGER